MFVCASTIITNLLNFTRSEKTMNSLARPHSRPHIPDPNKSSSRSSLPPPLSHLEANRVEEKRWSASETF